MRSRIVQVAVTFALVGFGTQAQLGAQQNSAVRSAVEVTPFVGIGSGSSARIGAAIRFEWTHRLGLELEMDYRRAEINALSSSVNLLYDLPRLGRALPYLVGGVGVEQYGTALGTARGWVRHPNGARVHRECRWRCASAGQRKLGDQDGCALVQRNRSECAGTLAGVQRRHFPPRRKVNDSHRPSCCASRIIA